MEVAVDEADAGNADTGIIEDEVKEGVIDVLELDPDADSEE